MSSARASNSCSAASWLRPVAPVFLFLLAALTAVPEGAGITLRLAEPGPLQVHARQTLSLMLFVDNQSGGPLELLLEALLPPGWRELTADGSFRVEAGVTESRLIGVLVSPQARAGTYTLAFRVHSATGPPAESRIELQAMVLPEPAVELRLLESPGFVVAGDPCRALFSLANPGNSDLWLELTAESRPDLVLRLRGIEDPGRLLLPAGEQREVELEAETPRGLRMAAHLTLSLTARPLELPEVRPVTASAHLEVVPVSAGGASLRRTLGGYSETIASASLDAFTDGYVQSSLSASGALDAEGRQLLALEIRKRLETGEETFANPIDRFSLAYRNPTMELLLGDHSYSLSPLLAMNELGRGAQASMALGPFDLKAQYFQNYWWQPGQGNFGLAADYTLNGREDAEAPLYQVGLNLLSSFDGRAAYGLWQRFNPGDLLSLQLDTALQSDADGSVHPALYAEAEGDQGSLYYRTRFLRAWTGFNENYADTQSLLLSAGLRLFDRELTLRGTYQLTDDNLELDPLLPDADRDRRIRLGATLAALPWGAQFSLDWENNLKLDRLVPADYNSLENLVRLGWKQHLGRFLGLRFDTALGRVGYPLTGNSAFSQSHALGLSYQPAAGWQADGSLAFVGQTGSTGSAWYTLAWNAGASRAWERTRLDGRLLNRYYFSEMGLSSLIGGIESTLAHSLRWGHSFSATGYFGFSCDISGEAVPDLRLTIRYGAPLNIPVGRMPEVAALRGRVYRVETGEPVRGLVLRLDGQAVSTNSKGEYAFHLAEAGKMYLQIDRGGLPTDLTPNRPIPIEVNIAGRDSRLDIGLVRAGEVLGTVVGYGLSGEVSPFAVSPSSPEETQRVRQGGFGNVLIELSNGAERRRRLTGPNGDFRFPDLRPGHYTLTVRESFIPRYYTLEQPVRELDIAAGQQETIEIRAVQDQRRVRLVQAEVAVTLERPVAQRGEWTVTAESPSQPGPGPKVAAAAPKPVAPAEAPAAPTAPEPAPAEAPPAAPAPEPASVEVPPPAEVAPSPPAHAPLPPPVAAEEAPGAAAAAPRPEATPGAAPTAPRPEAAPGAAPAAPPPEAAVSAAPTRAPEPEEAGPKPAVRAAPEPAAAASRAPAAAAAAPQPAPPPKLVSPAAPKASPATPKATPTPAPKAVAPISTPSPTRPSASAVRPPGVAPTPAPAPLVLPAPKPTPEPRLFMPGPAPTPSPLLMAPAPTPAPKPFTLPAPQPTPVPFFFLLAPAPTPTPSPLQE